MKGSVGMKKAIRGALLWLIIVSVLTGTALGTFAADNRYWEGSYSDVKPNHWYYRAVTDMSMIGVFDGVQPFVFGPHQTMTRAMAVTVLYRFTITIEGNHMERPDVTGLENPFTDVKPGSYYEAPVKWAYANGIVLGVSETSFAPNETITREQLACMLMRFGRYAHPKIFVDHAGGYIELEPDDSDDCSSWAYQDFCEASRFKLLQGDDHHQFNPQKNVSRAEAAQILYNYWQCIALPIWYKY